MKLYIFCILSLFLCFSGYAQTIEVSGTLCEPQMDKCDNDSTQFKIDLPNSSQWKWDFGDGTFSTRQYPRHLYRTAGTYTVIFTAIVSGSSQTFSTTITISSIPPDFTWQYKMGDSLPMFCKKKGGEIYTKLNPYPKNEPTDITYLWSPTGGTTAVVDVDRSGCWSVEVFNKQTTCSRKTHVFVTICAEQLQSGTPKLYFGKGAGLEKGTEVKNGVAITTMKPLTDGKTDTENATANYLNKSGTLLYYTDGKNIYNAQHNIIQNGQINANPTSSQPVLILPQEACRACEVEYSVLSLNPKGNGNKLNLSVLDSRLNTAQGGLSSKNTDLVLGDALLTDQIASVYDSTSNSYWILTHEIGNNKFHIFKANSEGVYDMGSQAIGLPLDTEEKSKGIISITQKKGLQKVVQTLPGPPKNIAQIFDFDFRTGKLSNAQTLDLGNSPPTIFGAEFSNSGDKLYISLSGDSLTNSKLLAFDLKASSISSSEKTIATSKNIYGGLQISYDNKIYLAIKDSKSLGVINKPEARADSVNFKENGQDLAGKISPLVLPQRSFQISSPNKTPGFDILDHCLGTKITFSTDSICHPKPETIRWNLGDGTISTERQIVDHVYKTAGTFIASVRLINDCLDTTIVDTIRVYRDPKPKFKDKILRICSTQYTLFFEDVASEKVEYEWFLNGQKIQGATGRTYVATKTGKYVVKAKVLDCEAKDSVRLYLSKDYKFPKKERILCSGKNIKLDAGEFTDPKGLGFTYKWSTNETTPSIIVNTQGVYKVMIHDSYANCDVMDEVTVFQKDAPLVETSIKKPSICGKSDGSIEITLLPANPEYLYKWETTSGVLANTTSKLESIKSGVYTLSVSGNSVCEFTETYEIQSIKENWNMLAIATNANCRTLTLGSITILQTNGTPTLYRLYNTDTQERKSGVYTKIIEALNPSTYDIEIEDESTGCKASQRNLRISLIPGDFLTVEKVQYLCSKQEYVLSSGSKGDRWLWNTGEDTPDITITEAGKYSVTAYHNTTGCQSTATIDVFPKDTAKIQVENSYPLCLSQQNSILITPKISSNFPISEFLWSNRKTTPTTYYDAVGEHWLRVKNSLGCFSKANFSIIEKCEALLVAPTAFTPNNDLKNDIFQIFTLKVSQFELYIYNRWGELLFYSNDKTKGWDGTFNGSPVSQDTYTWRAFVSSDDFPDKGKIKREGAFLLLR